MLNLSLMILDARFVNYSQQLNSVTRFVTSGLFNESVSPKDSEYPIRTVSNFSKIRVDFHSSR